MKVMVLGATGMLGHRMMLRLSPAFDVVGTTRRPMVSPVLVACRLVSGVRADDLATIEEALDAEQPDVLINCVGIIKQLPEAKDPLIAISINAMFPHQLAQMCQARGVRLIHFSTDCVFSGRGGPYNEDTASDADDLYGRTKFLGEVGGSGCLTLRTSIIGHELRGGAGLVEWFLSQRGGRMRGFAGALYSGLTTNEVADLMARLLSDFPSLHGVWHVAGDPISKYDLLGLVNDVYGLGVAIERETEFHCDRRLDASRFRAATGYQAPSWAAMINKMYRDAMSLRGGDRP